jgi:hypothetical protein
MPSRAGSIDATDSTASSRSSRSPRSSPGTGYHDPPWTFTGKALYQLSLVRVKDARKYVPDSIPLVNIFGWTLGGFYLARYDSSPAGAFDELVALAGLAWNFPTSCAWAARVYVNSEEARRHGVHVVGLPSRLARFERRPVSERAPPAVDWWGANTTRGKSTGPEEHSSTIDIYNTDRNNRKKDVLVCRIDMSSTRRTPGGEGQSPRMPTIQMFLPSFSGATAMCPDILKYSLRLSTKVSFLKPLKVHSGSVRGGSGTGDTALGDTALKDTALKDTALGDAASEDSIEAFVGTHVLGGKPLVCMSFENMRMDVQAPEVYQTATKRT